MDDLKEVDFYTYCKTCKYEKHPEEVLPCYRCLTVPANKNSHKPVEWTAKDA